MANFQTVQDRIAERYSEIIDEPADFIKSINKPLKQSFRINTIKGKKEEIVNKIRDYDSNIKNVKWCDNAFISNFNKSRK